MRTDIRPTSRSRAVGRFEKGEADGTVLPGRGLGDEQPGVCVREETGGIVWEGRWLTRRRG